ncbi:Bacillopeptidase F [Orchesella cincta]|uniref:Bacillopeptidase F n=1 Tax=Orchesella cincta TaxID=48709 RepID=A0A1D2MMG0_ORCCI|nr:Bacillopeptidase F [Orchesella cincta]
MLRISTCLLLAVGCVLAAPGPSNKISPELQNQTKANIIVSFVGGTKSTLQSINSQRFESRTLRLNALHDALVANAEQSQRGVLKLLSTHSSKVKSFWLTNLVYVKDADSALIQAIAQDDQVESITEEQIAHLIEPVDMKKVEALADEHQWGVVKIQAPEAWQELGTLSGEGVIIATVDTGVRGTHEALKDNFVGEYGWFDPSTSTPTPTDNNGHGTHTTGTIAGGKGIGVAPGAKWAACRGCASSACYQSDLLACGDFFACPTRADGSSPDCSKAPNVVSNSWGGGRGNTCCNTANSPADQNVIAVGSTTIDDAISSFSSVGPTTDGRMKPEVSAPGSNVISAYHTSDTAYVSLSGTSMACPHAGAIALLQVRDKNLSYVKAKEFLLGQTDKNLVSSGRTCEGIPDNQFPNHVFGTGRINALKSVRAQTLAMQG